MSKRVAIYTCIAGDYDDLLAPRQLEAGADYFCFTNQRFEHSGPWQLRSLPTFENDMVLASRYVKMHPHLLFPEHDLSVYVDGNVHVLGGVATLAANALQGAALALYEHPFRRCVFDEAQECALIGYDWWWRIRAQVGRYASEGLPAALGMHEANVIMRRHHEERLVLAMGDWWAEFRAGVRRDQLSLPYVLWKHGIDVAALGSSDPRHSQRNFSLQQRRKRAVGLWQGARRKCNRMALWCAR